MLGLRHGQVHLLPHDPAWAAAFRQEEVRLRSALRDVPCLIDHVGSTAVPELPAKPVLDVAIGVASRSAIGGVVDSLKGLGYQYRGDAGSDGGHVLVLEREALVRTHHVHVVVLGEPQWNDYIAFRDLLRRDLGARTAYAEAKTALAERHARDRRAYTRAKSDVIAPLLARARRPPDLGAASPREAVRALLTTPSGDVLLLHVQDPETGRRFWITPGGACEAGESMEAALRREVLEETGLGDLRAGPVVWVHLHTFRWCGETVHQRDSYAVVRADRFEPTRGHLADRAEQETVVGSRWWAPSDLEASTEETAPRRLATLLRSLEVGGLPTVPIDLGSDA